MPKFLQTQATLLHAYALFPTSSVRQIARKLRAPTAVVIMQLETGRTIFLAFFSIWEDGEGGCLKIALRDQTRAHRLQCVSGGSQGLLTGPVIQIKW